MTKLIFFVSENQTKHSHLYDAQMSELEIEQDLLAALGIHIEHWPTHAVITAASKSDLQPALTQLVESIASLNVPYSVYYDTGGKIITKIVYDKTTSKPLPSDTVENKGNLDHPTSQPLAKHQLDALIRERLLDLCHSLNLFWTLCTDDSQLVVMSNANYQILAVYLLAHNISFCGTEQENGNIFITWKRSNLSSIEEMVPWEVDGYKIKFLYTDACSSRFKTLETQARARIQKPFNVVNRQYFSIDLF